YHQSKLFVRKTPSDPTVTERSPYKHSYINEVTHWWDGSQIYGSNETTCSKLRSHNDGKLKLTSDGKLPTDAKGQEITGYNRNWWVGLSLFHTLFTLEHNVICDELKKHYPHWMDEQLFHTARLINAALMAKIHTIEWNSAINPNEAIYKGNHSNWYGLLTTLLKKKKDWHTVAHINIRNTELGGVVGNPIKKFNADFGLTEEFVEAYRIHSLLPETLEIRDVSSKHDISNIPFASSRYSGSSKIINKYGITSLWYSLGNQNPGQVVLNNYPSFMQDLAIPGNPVYDMGAVDILRARERGVPRYNEFRRQLGLNPIQSWNDLTTDQEVITKLKLLYGEDEQAIERLDFMIGTLAETHRPTGFAFGETMFQLFLLNATRRLQADRFYTDAYNVQHYTQEGMNWIDMHSLKAVLLRHYPELKDTGLANVTNAFEPWDEDQQLDPMRHPLRAFDPELKKDPWTGDN
ncbi:MAG: peroxidase family protein, partial [Saprospiraceae bacterium]